MEDNIFLEILKATIENDINNLREVKDNFERIGICMMIIERIEKIIELESTLKK
jgi:hypothetical protein